MKKTPAIFLLLTLLTHANADPRLSSWFTDNSGQYARLYETAADETAQNSVTTWNRGAGNQNQPTYAGVHEISSSTDWVYIRTTGLASHFMGPWYLNTQQTQNFPNFPANTATIYRIPRNPNVPTNKTGTGLGAIGYYVNGVAMFDARDAFSYSTANGTDSTPINGITGDAIWNRDAYVNESVTFDAGNAHQAGSTYHYHANPPGLRHQLGDSVDYNPPTNTYTENFNGQHSPILAWAADGFPIYGPYGYSDPNNPNSTVKRMLSGYQRRDGTNGTTNLANTGRNTLPTWAADFQNKNPNLPTNEHGPAVGTNYPLGHYLEDYDFVDLGDLDRHNGRQCVTPEFPNGTFAYFITIEADGTPAFPYAIGREFYGNPTGGRVNSITEEVTLHFQGGPEKTLTNRSAETNSNGDITLTWSVIEGGSYTIESSTTLDDTPWNEDATAKNPDGDVLSHSETAATSNNTRNFYRARLDSLAPYDDTGFNIENSGGGNNDGSFTAAFSTQPPLPPQNGVDSITVGGVSATIVSYDQANGTVELSFDPSSLAPGNYNAVLTFSPPNGNVIQKTSTNTYTVTGQNDQNNVLILIVDDWGIDASSLYNNATINPGITFAPMPRIQTLASTGLRFTRAYAQPLCSPTRATMLTGRHPFRHGVGNPTTNSSLPSSELTLPEILTAQSSPYAMASFGKWHLGGDANAPATIGGWPHFSGIRNGGVASYTNWSKTENGTTTNNFSTYSTSDQVNKAVEFINLQGNNPWFVWMAFNAPHTPYHNPPPNLHSYPAYPTNEDDEVTGANRKNAYQAALEALDTEIARLLLSVDLSKTNIILLGDNGTPNAVVQAPFGNDHSKGDLYNGGCHVPFVATGPDITASGTSDKLVHCVDIFSTVLDLVGINPTAATSGTTIDSRSLLPIFQGTDTTDRCVVVEKFGDTAGDNGRAIISDDYPEYKLIIFGDKDDPNDTPTHQLFHLATDPNELAPIDLNNLSPEQQNAYTHLTTKNTTLGGTP